MIFDIVIALCIFYFGIPVAILALTLLFKLIGGIIQSIGKAIFAVLDGVAWAIGWIIGRRYRI